MEQKPPTEDSSWKLALFSEPTNCETLPTKALEVFALCFCVAQSLTLLYVAYSIGGGLLPAVAAFSLPGGGGTIGVLMNYVLIVMLIIALAILMLTISIGFIFRQKWALFGMVVFTVLIPPIISYFVCQMLPNAPKELFSDVWLSVSAFSLQYFPSIVLGLIMFRRLR